MINYKKWLRYALIPVLAALVLGGCARMSHGSGAASASSAGTKAEQSAKAFASSPQGKKDIAEGKQIMKACAPKSQVAQLTWVHQLVKRHGDGPATREAFAACAGVPKSKIPAFEATVKASAITAVEAAGKAKLHHQKATPILLNYVEVTLPNTVEQYRNGH